LKESLTDFIQVLLIFFFLQKRIEEKAEKGKEGFASNESPAAREKSIEVEENTCYHLAR